MKKIVSNLIKILIAGSLILLAVIYFDEVHAKASGFLMPGPVSATHPKDEPLNGFNSHAEFEQECAHCHAPIHCVTDTRCQDCHLEIALQRSQVEGLHGKLPGTDRCQNCHVEHRGRDVVISELAYTGVDHYGLTGFSLEYHQVDYANTPMNCGSCHHKDRFIDATLDCLTCHVDADHDFMAQHVELYGTACVDCHDGVDRMREFDHDDYYALQGEHSDVECILCHKEYVYAETPQDCSGCHEEPELHAGGFGLDCSRCHTPVAWVPAQLTYHTFLLEHGENPVDGCKNCHTTQMTDFDCFACHEDHTPEQMEAYHLNCGLATEYASQTCIECHPTGESSDTAGQECDADQTAGSQGNN